VTKAELYDRAKKRPIHGRSKMSKDPYPCDHRSSAIVPASRDIERAYGMNRSDIANSTALKPNAFAAKTGEAKGDDPRQPQRLRLRLAAPTSAVLR
jgi:hypothetical protein